MKLNEIFAQPTLIMPIGPSGAGKSTLFRRLKSENPSLRSFSLDDLRHEWYDPTDYAKAWKASTEDRQFEQKANQRFIEMIKQKQDIYIDNTNLSPKRRRFYLDLARKNGYKTVGYILDVDVDTLVARQSTRTDKSVPAEAVRRQHQSMVPPQANEFDEVIRLDDKGEEIIGVMDN